MKTWLIAFVEIGLWILALIIAFLVGKFYDKIKKTLKKMWRKGNN